MSEVAQTGAQRSGTGPAPARESHPRLVGPDVVRAVALIGVVVMNYHGYLNGANAIAGDGASFAQRLFDPWEGVLSTRFAATFVLVAGVGVTLLTNRSRLADDAPAISANRLRLVRRGFLLYFGGLVLDWIWPGTILFFYGALFVIAATLFTLRTRTLLIVAALVAVAAAGLHWWGLSESRDGHDVSWLFSPNTLGVRSPRGLLFDTFVNGTHPLLPWLAFLCVGMVIGRLLPTLPTAQLIGIGAVLLAGSYLLSDVLTSSDPADVVRNTVLSTRPFDRGLLYTLGALGSSIVAFTGISWLAERYQHTAPVTFLAAAGRMTLTLYVAHVLVFNLFVHELRWVGGTGLDTALVFAITFWALALVVGAWWQRFVGLGPLERAYRAFGG